MEALPPEDILGSWLVGTCIELWLMGVLAGQFVKYFGLFGKSDPRWLHIYIYGLAFLSVVKSCVNFGLLWHKTIILLGDLEGTGIIGADTTLNGVVGILTVSTVFYVQGYYLHRLFLLSNNNAYIVAPIALLLFVGWPLIVLANGLFMHGAKSVDDEEAALYYAYFSLVIPGDVILTLSTAFFLLRFRKNVLAPSASVLTTLIRLTFQTAAPATLTMIANFIVGVTFPHRSQVAAGLNVVLGKLWVFSLMWTLNARADKGSKMRSVYTSRAGETPTGTQAGLVSTVAFRRDYGETDTGALTRSIVTDAPRRRVSSDARSSNCNAAEVETRTPSSDMEFAPSPTQVHVTVSSSSRCDDGQWR